MHFFIDHLKLGSQLATDQYGPDITNPTLIYNVTSQFKLNNEAKAFACCTGEMIVQQSIIHTSLVNIIIKPHGSLGILLGVKYFIYRGILKNSLINNNYIIAEAPTNNELIARIWKYAPTGTTSFNAGSLGFDNNLLSDSENVENIFNFSKTNVKPVTIREGWWFGNFTNTFKIGFEVIMVSNKMTIDLKHVRADKYQINVSGLSGLDAKSKREEILYFLDPAALFGMQYATGIKYSTYTGSVKSTTSSLVNNTNNMFSFLLNPFYTKNRVYLDIRSEKGYSYNFYNNYFANLISMEDIKIGQGTSPIVNSYKTNEWPIVFLDDSQITSASKNDVRLVLRMNDNNKPIIYLENLALKSTNKTSKYIKDGELYNEGTLDWTKIVKLTFPNTGNGTSKYNISTYIKLYYFRQTNNTATPNTVINYEKYYNSAFCSIDLPNLGDPSIQDIHIKNPDPVYVNEPLQTNGTGNFGFTAINGAYWDTQRILFYSILKDETSKNIISEKYYINTYRRKIELGNKRYSQSSLRVNIDVLCREYQTVDGQIRIPSINSYKEGDILSNKENALLLGLTINEITSIKNAVGLSNKHDRYIFLEPDQANPLLANGIRYYRYTVKIQGLQSNGEESKITPLLNGFGSSIRVYSRDKMFFSSIGFGALEHLSPGQNRIEFHIYHNGFIKINDNVDLSLIHDVQNIYYIYHNVNGNTFEICNLDLIQIDKMGSGKHVTALPGGEIRQIDYTPFGISAKTSYIYPNGTVITNGTKDKKPPNYKLQYLSLGKKAFLVSLTEINFPTLNIHFTYSNTRRRYCSPEVTAVFLGSLARTGLEMKSTGSCFEDGTPFPSVAHNNGFAIDTLYLKVLASDQAFINAMNYFGCTEILKGVDSYCSQLQNARILNKDPTLHDSHLHSGKVVLNVCNLDE